MKRGTSIFSWRSCHVEWQEHKDAAGCEETGRQTVWSVQGCQASGTRGIVGGVGIATTLEGT